MAKTLVLGADGFIGYHLTMGLLEAGHSVRAFSRMRDGKATNLPQERANLELFPGDFFNREDLDRALDGVDYVFHFVSTTNPAISAKDPLLDIRTNMRMSVELFQLCASHKVKRVIFPSTGGAIYGRDAERAFTEEDLTEPISPYAIGKLAIEGYQRFFKQVHDLDYLTLRISNPFGERQNVVGSQGVIPIFMNLIKQGLPLNVFGDGSTVRDYISVGDLTKAIVRSFDQPAKHRLYNLGSGTSLSINELIAVLENTMGKKAQINYHPARPADTRRVVLDVSRFESEFGKVASTPFEEAVRATWKFVEQRKDPK